MRRRVFISLLCGLGAIIPAIAQQPAVTEAVPKAVLAPEMRRQFDGLYESWREAMVNKDFNGWQKITAASRQVKTQNRIVSQKLRYPGALFNVPLVAPDISKLLHVAVLIRGDTASGIYFGKADFGISDPSEVTDNFVVLRFLREFGIWKFDNLRVVKIGDDADVLLQIRNRDYRFLEGPEFQPPPAVPPVPPLVKFPDFIGEVRIRAIGYKATVEINGQDRNTVSNIDARDLINGGLKEGNNRIRVTTEPVEVESGTPEILEIGVYAADGPNKPARRVYHFRTEPGAPGQPDFTTQFVVLETKP